MNDLAASAGWGLVVAASLLAGAAAAALLRLSASVAATMTAFGGGILLAAVALELVPEADAGAGAALTARAWWSARSSTSAPTPGSTGSRACGRHGG